MSVVIVPAGTAAPVSPQWGGSVARMIRRGVWGIRGHAWIICAAMIPAAGLPVAGHADDAKPMVIGACRLATVGTGVVSAVLDARTIVIEAGQVRLAGIEPAAAAHDEPARLALAEELAGRPVVLRSLKAEADRYGRIVAHVFVDREGSERWIQAELLARGMARVSARSGDRACATELLARERTARDAKLGLWAEPDYSVRRAEDPAAVAVERGRFAIVEGKVLSVRESGGTIYVNFGRRWSEDFTVTILKRNERSFAAAGLEPKRLEGRRVRVRGFVEERGGPWIEAGRPEQIELLN